MAGGMNDYANPLRAGAARDLREHLLKTVTRPILFYTFFLSVS